MKYEVILFDADETLYDFKKSESVAFRETMLEFAIEYDEIHHFEIYKEINIAIWKELELGLITQSALKVERFRRFAKAISADFDPAFFAKSYMKHLSHASFIYDDSLPLIESLKKNYRMAIITNGLADVQDNRIRNSFLGSYFETVVVSDEVKVSKPEPGIFEIALNQMNHRNKSTVLMVGDSLSSDIRGGINFGVDTCWYNPNKAKNTTNIHPTYEIHQLSDLHKVLNQ